MAKKAPIILPSKGLTSLHDILLANDKNGLLKPSTMSLGFPTGYLPFDFRNGYVVQNFDDDDNVVGTYNNLGFFGGTFNTIIGKSGVAKTTFVAQACANMQRYIEQKFGKLAEIYHFDVEQASNYTRIKKVTNLPISKIKKGYFIYQDSTHIEDIYTIICRVAMHKEANKDLFMMKTGIMDEFNQEICTYVPTFLIVDSLPSLSIKENEMSDEIAGSTYANRVAKQLARFYKSLGPIVKRYNLVVFAINHINTKIEINPMAKTQPQLMYLKMDEALPCGAAPIYFAHNILKFISAGKCKQDEDGFDGFYARCELLKSRSNKAGKECTLVYDQDVGFDPYLSLYKFLDDQGAIQGRNPYRFLKGFEDIRFDSRDFRTALNGDKRLYDAVYGTSYPILEKVLSNTKFNEVDASTDIAHIYNRLCESYSEAV